jgi:hypothetical protein
VGRRIHEESVRLEFVGRLDELEVARQVIDKKPPESSPNANSELSAHAKRLSAWIDQIHQAKPGTVVRENVHNNEILAWTFSDASYDFFGRLRVLNDLYAGRPPYWVRDPHVNSLAGEYGLADPPISETEVKAFRSAYWVTFGVATVMPLLLLALVVLLPRSLKDYYSAQKQLEAGNFELQIVLSSRPSTMLKENYTNTNPD